MHQTHQFFSDPAGQALRISRRFEGWSGIANGGLLAGLFLRELGGPLEVTLRRPTPVERLLRLHHLGDSAELCDDGGLLASAVKAPIEVDAPETVSFDRAVEAREAYSGFREIPFPTCFVCGPERSPADALRIFAGAVEPGRVAAPWVPSPAFERAGGAVAPEYVAAALDCPGAWAIASLGGRFYAPMLLGRLTLDHRAPVRVGIPHVVVGLATGEDGRKRTATTAIYDPDDRLCAVAHAVWFPRA